MGMSPDDYRRDAGYRRSVAAPEARSLENPSVPISDTGAMMALFNLNGGDLAAVTIDNAMKVPAFHAAVTFLSRTLAALPLHSYRNTDKGPEKITGRLQTIVHEAPNPEWTSFALRQYFWQQVFTGGRGLMWIEKAGSNIAGLWPMEAQLTTVKRRAGRRFYDFEGREYAASEVIDVPFMLRSNQLGVFSPLHDGGKAIQLAIAMNDYASGFFAGGGVPPLSLTGPMPQGADALNRAMNDVARVIDAARRSDKPIFPMPPGHELKPIGFDPEKGQMTDARRFQVEEIARLFNLPPVFVQDLTRATFTNSEQQDLHLVKHLIGQWAAALEQELNLKLFGQFKGIRYVKHNVDGLLRGDFKARMEGLAKAVNSSILMPDEARALEDRPAAPGGDRLYMQGATVALGTQPGETPPNNGDNGDADANAED